MPQKSCNMPDMASLYQGKQTPIKKMMRRSNLINGLLKLASEEDMKGNFEKAIGIYSAAYNRAPDNIEVKAILYGALKNYRDKLSKEGADKEILSGIDEKIAELEDPAILALK